MGAKKLLGEAAQLMLDQNYSVTEAAQAMNIGKSTMDKWVRQLKQEWSTKIGQNLSRKACIFFEKSLNASKIIQKVSEKYRL